MGYGMSLKIHFLHSHINFFLPNLGAVSDEAIAKMENKYQVKFDRGIMEDFRWMLVSDIPEPTYKRSTPNLISGFLLYYDVCILY